jgi:hypothetical protein
MALLESYSHNFLESVGGVPFRSFHDCSCHVNYKGQMHEGYLMGYSIIKPIDQFLIYIENFAFGSDGTEYALTRGEPFRGMSENHVWCSLAEDPMDLLKTQNTIYMLSEYRSLRRHEYLTVDKCTYDAMLAKFGNNKNRDKDQEAIQDGLYNLFCNKAVRFAARHAIRQLDLED